MRSYGPNVAHLWPTFAQCWPVGAFVGWSVGRCRRAHSCRRCGPHVRCCGPNVGPPLRSAGTFGSHVCIQNPLGLSYLSAPYIRARACITRARGWVGSIRGGKYFFLYLIDSLTDFPPHFPPLFLLLSAAPFRDLRRGFPPLQTFRRTFRLGRKVPPSHQPRRGTTGSVGHES